MEIVKVPVPLGLGDNALSIMGRVTVSMKKNGQSQNVEPFREEAMSGDYTHLLQTCLKYAYEAPSDTLADDGDMCEDCGQDAENARLFVINDTPGRYGEATLCESCYFDALTCSQCGGDLENDGSCEDCDNYHCEQCGEIIDSLSHTNRWGESLCVDCWADEMEDKDV